MYEACITAVLVAALGWDAFRRYLATGVQSSDKALGVMADKYAELLPLFQEMNHEQRQLADSIRELKTLSGLRKRI